MCAEQQSQAGTSAAAESAGSLGAATAALRCFLAGCSAASPASACCVLWLALFVPLLDAGGWVSPTDLRCAAGAVPFEAGLLVLAGSCPC